jgi:transcriptional regulator with PAS, ATPase and Fis domain
LAQGTELTAADLPLGFTDHQHASQGDTLQEDLPAVSLADVERLHINRVMTMTGGNKSRAAELLGIGLTTLYRKLDEYKTE